MLHAAAAGLATALAVWLVVVQPWVGRRRYRRLLSKVKSEPAARLCHYLRGIVGEWSFSGIIVVIGLLAGRSAASIGLRWRRLSPAQAWLVTEVAVLLVVTAVIMRYGGTRLRDILRRQVRGFAALLPRSQHERLAFAGLSITAGVCEELIFRGFGIAYLRWVWPSAPDLAIVIIVASAFGLVHLYQGPRGVLLTGLIGAYLTGLVLSTGSLLPAMAIHALLDLRVLALPDLDPPLFPPLRSSERVLVEPPDL